MNAIQNRLAVLESYRPELTARSDLDTFWNETLRQFASKPLNDTKTLTEPLFPGMDVYDVRYEGFDDTPIAGWFLVPALERGRKVPCIVTFHGYTGGRGYPERYAQWVLMGYAVLALDVRGQRGDTGNRLASPHGMAKGWISQGIMDKYNCYYRAVAIDAVKAVEWASRQDEVDGSRIVVEGSSQGGGLALLAAALSDKPALAVANVPNMCHMDFGVLNSTGSLTELAAFVNEFPDRLDAVLDTLSYFDIMNLAERIRIPVIVSVGLKDTVCMPETVYAAYNRLTCEKEIHAYPFMGHEHIGYHNRKTIEFVKRKLGSPN
ncbi:acetylxylan esterase [Paenibacillus flagellatus]|uniref:Acetylesterase n=1 Tax=Paenibacillus flagellatus TaxID=2211139 RepID=A0A2V5K3R9_9BACL|nr:alpha/beta fold hydrolase [Paenibacillus flagellatus]PYI53909.1 acetylesterase [Paenibacillus flagellatus]